MSITIPVVEGDKFVAMSRYGDDRFVKAVDENTLVIKCECLFLRTGFHKDETDFKNPKKGYAFIDFDGGPFLAVGSFMKSDKYRYEILEIHRSKSDSDLAEFILKVNKSKLN